MRLAKNNPQLTTSCPSNPSPKHIMMERPFSTAFVRSPLEAMATGIRSSMPGMPLERSTIARSEQNYTAINITQQTDNIFQFRSKIDLKDSQEWSHEDNRINSQIVNKMFY
ncbi:Oidioi.mRNA.OKI2018_I69.chr2.g5008.t1.cds [Oikopleura dioica]|uniref:Oidioi.mRNA.OKI2018_I69.chr2.g5008.t1.cds n=1 Tax=Oikopleura dioica TaxID=34765 RepID=A0ABN7T5P7_OIKDI|nr:Oidioi.mRNA.OKI2018_I69.chr2.g5008.t1.cds [Oikopleura dioica]